METVPILKAVIWKNSREEDDSDEGALLEHNKEKRAAVLFDAKVLLSKPIVHTRVSKVPREDSLGLRPEYYELSAMILIEPSLGNQGAAFRGFLAVFQRLSDGLVLGIYRKLHF